MAYSFELAKLFCVAPSNL